MLFLYPNILGFLNLKAQLMVVELFKSLMGKNLVTRINMLGKHTKIFERKMELKERFDQGVEGAADKHQGVICN